ncbi:hypothetical protein AB0M34_24540 [Nocardia sp. NPDC050193]
MAVRRFDGCGERSLWCAERNLLTDEETFDLGGPIGKDEIHDAMNRSA